MLKENLLSKIFSLIITIIMAFIFYQMDFRSFYIAGKAISLGLDPYLNNELLGLIDSCELRSVSRFIYPPLSAFIFYPLSILNFQFAKIIWSLLILFSFYKILDIFKFKKPFLIFLTFPVLFALERGQIDLIICLLIITSFKSKNFYVSLLFLFLATVLKLFPVLLLPLFLFKWRNLFTKKKFLFIGFLSLCALFLPSLYLNLNYLKFFFTRKLLDTFVQQSLDCLIIENKIFLINEGGFIFNNVFIHGQLNPLVYFKYPFALGLIVLIIIISIDLYKKIKFQKSNSIFALLLFYLPVIQLLNDKVWIMTLVYFIPFFLFHWSRISKIEKIFFLGLMFTPPIPYLQLLIFPFLICLTIKIYFTRND
jgi:hypothetical protein